MFSAKFFALFVALLGFINVAVAATPPACLLDVIGAQPDPSDVETICNKKSVPSDISSKCDDQKSAAMSAFASVCKDAGVTVATSASASSTKSSSASASASATGSSTTGGSSVSTPGASTGSSSDSSSASSTAGAASSTPAPSNNGERQLTASILGVGALAFAVGSILLLLYLNPFSMRPYSESERRHRGPEAPAF